MAGLEVRLYAPLVLLLIELKTNLKKDLNNKTTVYVYRLCFQQVTTKTCLFVCIIIVVGNKDSLECRISAGKVANSFLQNFKIVINIIKHVKK